MYLVFSAEYLANKKTRGWCTKKWVQISFSAALCFTAKGILLETFQGATQPFQLDLTLQPRPDSDPRREISGQNQVRFRSWGEVFEGGQGWRSRSSWSGSVAPRKVSSIPRKRIGKTHEIQLKTLWRFSTHVPCPPELLRISLFGGADLYLQF